MLVAKSEPGHEWCCRKSQFIIRKKKASHHGLKKEGEKR